MEDMRDSIDVGELMRIQMRNFIFKNILELKSYPMSDHKVINYT